MHLEKEIPRDNEVTPSKKKTNFLYEQHVS
jgi:hypothetical protein